MNKEQRWVKNLLAQMEPSRIEGSTDEDARQLAEDIIAFADFAFPPTYEGNVRVLLVPVADVHGTQAIN